MRRSQWLLISCAALTSCGGGGGGTTTPIAVVTPAPTPTPSVTPTPTPTPTPSVGALGTGEVKPMAGATILATTMELTTTGGVAETNGVITGGATSDRLTIFDTPNFSAIYNAGYSLSDTVNSAAFGSAQLVQDSTAPNGNGVVFFSKIVGQMEDYLALYQQSTYTSNVKGSGYTTAVYGGTAGWQHTVVGASSRRTRLDYFAYGSATPVSAMPRSGVVVFSMLGSGNYATDTDLIFTASQNGNTISVDFGTGTISGTLGVAGRNFFKNETGGIGFIPLNGSFSGNSLSMGFNNSTLGPASAVSGQFHLLFVGPNANELIVTYVANDGSRAIVGAAVGVRDPYRN